MEECSEKNIHSQVTKNNDMYAQNELTDGNLIDVFGQIKYLKINSGIEEDDSCYSDNDKGNYGITDDEEELNENLYNHSINTYERGRTQNEIDEDFAHSSPYADSNFSSFCKLELNSKTPEKLLHRSKRKAKYFASKGQVDQSLTEYIRCIALVRIIYGLNHWRLGCAHAMLADAYLELKSYYLQAIEHAEIACEILSNLPEKPRSQEKRAEILKLLSIVHLTMGRASMFLSNYHAAGQHLLQSQCFMEEFRKNRHAKEKKKILLLIKVLSSLAEFKESKKEFHDASEIWKEILNLKDPPTKGEIIQAHERLGHVLTLMGPDECQEGIEHLNTAFILASKTFGNNSMKALKIELKLAKVLLNVDPSETELSENHFRHILTILSTCRGKEEDDIYFKAEEELVALMIESDRQEEARDQLKWSLARKVKFFGDYSNPCLTANKMLASFALSKGELKLAVKYLKKCEEIEKTLLPPNHPSTDETQFTLQLLMQNPEVSKMGTNFFGKKRKPMFISTVRSNPGF